MKLLSIFFIAAVSCILTVSARAQSNFSSTEYGNFLRSNQDLPSGTLLSRHAPKSPYFKSRTPVLTGNYAYLDSIGIKYGLTGSEKDLLTRNGFVVTERQMFIGFGQAYRSIYNLDLPVFITTDAVLQALHNSYDSILMDLEMYRLRLNLIQFLDALSGAYPKLMDRYETDKRMKAALEDVDLYVTIARSLLAGAKGSPQLVSPQTVDTVWNAIHAEKMVQMPLFTETPRKLDFSQFTVRGHYTRQGYVQYLGPYFKCMMWLGRTDFLLTPPPAGDGLTMGREDLRRMSIDALLLNELSALSGESDLLDENDHVITFLVGESDNLTPKELAGVVRTQNLDKAGALFDDTVFNAFQSALLATPEAGQRILSDFFIMDPFADKPDPLPVSFRLMGQKFIIDSYIFSNVVYDRIMYNGKKVWRPMPDPLDALFVLGNDDALPLLKEQLDTYHYSAQLADLRYLVDAYDDNFWGVSLYNTWLSAIRELNPSANTDGLPFFMLTAAWRQEKINTQLASWAQLRHDNLLYAKQSYTGGAVCSFPYSYVEPYPEFFRQIGLFAERAGAYFSKYGVYSTPIGRIPGYFSGMREVMSRLETIARKELARQSLTENEKEYLREMLYQNTNGVCGAPPVLGWYRDLFYDSQKFDDMSTRDADFVIADVHTQPTDEFGSVVGRVLHAGTGWVNLGVFLVDSPFPDMGPTAFAGPVMSYYETITSNFDRLTDERWNEMLQKTDALPPRPDWVNIYLADRKGSARITGRELPGIVPTGVAAENVSLPGQLKLLSVYPNPFNPAVTVRYTALASGQITLIVYDIMGRKLKTLAEGYHSPGTYSVRWNSINTASGLYFCRLKAGMHEETVKMLLIR
ncbi:MAG: DUF3160 domain-containing protein [Candidatus Latescibacter sp.]|nr:DUF3160 domain-containing protein [Candidatus Latescibacter sp.]